MSRLCIKPTSVYGLYVYLLAVQEAQGVQGVQVQEVIRPWQLQCARQILAGNVAAHMSYV
jgi:hypothetical protein